MKRVVVVGFGNPLRGDDAVGWRVADTLAERWGERVTFLTGHQPLPEWAPVLAGADMAFVIDAAVQQVDRLRFRRLRPAPSGGMDGHALAPEQLLGLTEVLFGRAPTAYVLRIPTESLDFGERLSDRTAAAAASAVRLLHRRLAALT